MINLTIYQCTVAEKYIAFSPIYTLDYIVLVDSFVLEKWHSIAFEMHSIFISKVQFNIFLKQNCFPATEM